MKIATFFQEIVRKTNAGTTFMISCFQYIIDPSILKLTIFFLFVKITKKNILMKQEKHLHHE